MTKAIQFVIGLCNYFSGLLEIFHLKTNAACCITFGNIQPYLFSWTSQVANFTNGRLSRAIHYLPLNQMPFQFWKMSDWCLPGNNGWPFETPPSVCKH